MSCPVCDDGYIKTEIAIPDIPHPKCKTCGGTGEVDKIRQLYIDSELLDIDEVDPVIIFTAGYKSRDKEIKKLKAEANCWKAQYMKLYERG